MNPCRIRLRLIELVVVVVVVVVGVEGVMVNGEGERWRMVRIVRCRERRIHGFREREREKVMSFLGFLFLLFFLIKKILWEEEEIKKVRFERERVCVCVER